MAKIQCPHCKAVNQDVTLDDPCWQCGTILGAPVSALETGQGPPSSEVNPANATGSSSLPIQKEIERDQPHDGISPSERPRVPSSRVGLVVAIGFVIALILIVLIVLLNVKH